MGKPLIPVANNPSRPRPRKIRSLIATWKWNGSAPIASRGKKRKLSATRSSGSILSPDIPGSTSPAGTGSHPPSTNLGSRAPPRGRHAPLARRGRLHDRFGLRPGLINSIAIRCTKQETKSGNMAGLPGSGRLPFELAGEAAGSRFSRLLTANARRRSGFLPQQPRQPAQGAAFATAWRPARARPAARAGGSPVRHRARRPWPDPCVPRRSP